MYIEINWRDYKRFGPDGSSSILAQWLMVRLQQEYGSEIETISVTGNCRSLTGPNKNLAPIFEKFEGNLSVLRDRPSIRYLKKKRELDINYATVWPTAEEFAPDDLMLKVGTFRRSYQKLIILLEQANEKIGMKTDFNFDLLIGDIKNLEPELPNSLDDLAELYVDLRKKKGEQDVTPKSDRAGG